MTEPTTKQMVDAWITIRHNEGIDRATVVDWWGYEYSNQRSRVDYMQRRALLDRVALNILNGQARALRKEEACAFSAA